MARGGHFAAMEQPEALARDVLDFVRPLRGAVRLGSWSPLLCHRHSPPLHVAAQVALVASDVEDLIFVGGQRGPDLVGDHG